MASDEIKLSLFHLKLGFLMGRRDPSRNLMWVPGTSQKNKELLSH